LSIKDFVDYLKGLGVTTPIYALAFPASSPEQCMIVEIGQGFSKRGSVAEIVLTVTVRAGHPQDAEAISQDVINLLKDRTDGFIGGKQVILIKSQQLVPNYLGKDAEGKHYYMNNFRVLVND
jgi:Bacteriophage minor capsid protein